MPHLYKIPELSASPYQENLSFAAYCEQARVNLNTPRGRAVARVREWTESGVTDACFTTWFEFFRFLDRRVRVPRDDIQHFRALWNEYQTKSEVPLRMQGRPQ